MTSEPRLRVLVVEDELKWRQALCELYERRFRAMAVPAQSVDDAIRMLKHATFELLSTDLILDSGNGGADVLRKAHELRSCSAAVVCSATHPNQVLQVLTPFERAQRSKSLEEYLTELFPRHHFFRKNLDLPLKENISRFERSITAAVAANLGLEPRPDPGEPTDPEGDTKRFEAAAPVEEQVPGEVPAGLLDRHDYVRRIGGGGMGSIYEVRHRELGELRAAKIRRDGTEPEDKGRERFAREARAVARLRHPGLPILHDYGTDGAGWIVFELIEGTNLRDLLANEGIPPLGVTLEIGYQTANAMAYLHSHGVLHRDVSPDNLMLTAIEGRLQVKLLDLGIASDQAFAGDRLTEHGIFFGKPHYAPLERFIGQADARSDIFSLGAVLFELLTGESHLGQPLPRHPEVFGRLQLGSRVLDSFAKGRVAPTDVRSVVQRCLARTPAGRPRDASELEAALDQLRDRWPMPNGWRPETWTLR